MRRQVNRKTISSSLYFLIAFIITIYVKKTVLEKTPENPFAYRAY